MLANARCFPCFGRLGVGSVNESQASMVFKGVRFRFRPELQQPEQCTETSETNTPNNIYKYSTCAVLQYVICSSAKRVTPFQ